MKYIKLTKNIFLDFSQPKLKTSVGRIVFHFIISEKWCPTVKIGQFPWRKIGWLQVRSPQFRLFLDWTTKMDSFFYCESGGLLGFVFHFIVLEKWGPTWFFKARITLPGIMMKKYLCRNNLGRLLWMFGHAGCQPSASRTTSISLNLRALIYWPCLEIFE